MSRATRTITSAVVLAMVVALGVGCARTEDPKPAVTGQGNIGTPTPPSTGSRSTATTSRGSAAPATPNAVDIKDYSFLPAELRVAVGTTVTWTNAEGDPPVDHYVKSAPGQPAELDSGRLSPGQSYHKTFGQAGEFDYFCDIHNFMKAKVIVQ